MQKVGPSVIFSPSDLNHFLECEHLIQLERARGDRDLARVRDPHAELLAAKGQEHERARLERFRAEGRSVVEIAPPSIDGNWERAAQQTVAAMREGAQVIYQGVFVDDEWCGISDFLVRVDEPSQLGPWSYEAWDTKLARHTKTYFVLQLCFYTEQLARIQGITPDSMVVALGTGECERLRYRDFDAYYRSVRRRFIEATASSRPTYPYPVPHCGLCDHRPACERQWDDDDHLTLVAHMRRDQIKKLNDAGVTTVAQLGVLDPGSPVGISSIALHRLVAQAALQTHHRRTGRHRYELLPVNAQTGFRLLPAPSLGDVFFDMEGYPFFEPARGLEYLFGAVTVDHGVEFHAFHANTRDEEKAAFERFIDFVHARLKRWPDLHVYHYSAYEPTALKRLMSEHSTREDEIDNLLRGEVFVDLYQVVRQSLRISHPSYSIKKVRTFFMSGAGKGLVTDGADSILEFDRYLRTADPRILDAITRYNEEDCVSTAKLLDWLLDRKREAEQAAGQVIPWKVTEPVPVTPEREREHEEIRQRRELLLARGDDESRLLAHLLNYHRREAKPEWWAFFERRKKSLDALLVDTESIAYLEPVAGIAPERNKQSLVHTLAFPPQEFKLAPGAAVDDPYTEERAGDIEWLDAANGRLGLKRGPKFADAPLPSAIVIGKPLDQSVQRQAICRVADDVLNGAGRFGAARDLLARAVPRFLDAAPGARLQTLELHEQRSLVERLHESYLVIQGPPGSGKTWTGARLIVALVAAGKRVGVAATSHKAIHNLLEEVEQVAIAAGVTFTGIKKSSNGADTEFQGRFFSNADEAKEVESSGAQLVAGTSWLFAREGMQQQLDYLFVDEAGQVSLADAIAMSTAARNLVLLGDPQQLPHVTQGIHPEGSGCSVLGHLLDGASTVAEDRGLFLARSWRMHPDVCAFVSALAYDGRLASADTCARQRIDSPGMSGTGLRYLPVAHEGNSQQSPEEAQAIAAEVRRLLESGRFTDVNGAARTLTAADILVVAPYNMQVRTLRGMLPPAVDVGTVDKFQGREAPIVFFSMTSSSGEEVPRGLEFLFNRHRFNVAISRAKCLAVVVASPRLAQTRCRTVDQMRLVNALCRFIDERG